jgi:hypothetical protein
MEARRRKAVQDWLDYRAKLEQGGRDHVSGVSPRLSVEEIRQRAVAAWRSLQAREVESPPSDASRRDRNAERDPQQAAEEHAAPGLADDLSV